MRPRKMPGKPWNEGQAGYESDIKDENCPYKQSKNFADSLYFG